jgi:hypothetical protein
VQAVDLPAVIQREMQPILDEASGALARSNVPHYRELSSDERRRRLGALLELVHRCLADRDLMPMLQYSKQLAEERFTDGVEIGSVQAAFNVLEETLWRRVVLTMPPADLPEAVGMLATVLGAGRDELARTYVTLASKQRVTSLDLSALFRGGR